LFIEAAGPRALTTSAAGGAACFERFAAIYDEDPHADLRDDLVMNIRSRSAATNLRKCLICGLSSWTFHRWWTRWSTRRERHLHVDSRFIQGSCSSTSAPCCEHRKTTRGERTLSAVGRW